MALKLAYNKNKVYKTLDYWFRDIINSTFSEKGMGLVCPQNFVSDFLRKLFLMLHYINWPNFIVLLSLLFKILDNMCITIVSWPFEVNLIFLIKPICYMTKKSRLKLKYQENEKSFWGEIKSIVKGLSITKNYLRTESMPLREWQVDKKRGIVQWKQLY